MQRQCLSVSTVCLDLGALGSTQLMWVMNEKGWQLCFILTTVGHHQTAYKFLKECLKLTLPVLREMSAKFLK